MAQSNEEALHRTDANEVRFQETVPHNQKYSTTQQGITSMPKEAPDTGFHVDKPTSVSETGYGGVSGRGVDISEKVAEAREHSSKLNQTQSFTDTAKEVARGVKDLATGKKQHEASAPVVDQSGAHRRHEQEEEGMGDKMKDFITGQKPGRRGAVTSEGSEEWPPSATYKDPQGHPIEGPRDDDTKKEGVMSKVIDKFS